MRFACAFLFLVAIMVTGNRAHSIERSEIISIGRSYSVSPQPNYMNYSKIERDSVLTDGNLSGGRMWTSRRALTWKGGGSVSVALDLGEVANLDQIAVHSAAGVVGDVHFPSHIYVYVSREGENYAYLGDMIKGGGIPVDDGYIERYLSLDKINAAARFVRLEVILSGSYFSLDEVSVRKGAGAGVVDYSLKISALKSDVNVKKNGDLIALHKYRDGEFLNRIGAPGGRDPYERRSKLLRANYPNNRFVVQMVSPWSRRSPLDLPVAVRGSEDFSLLLPMGGCDYKAFIVSNTAISDISISMEESVDRNYPFKLDIFEAREARDSGGGAYYDPLVALDRNFSVALGESKFVMLRFCGLQRGAATYRLRVKSGGDDFKLNGTLRTVPIDLRKTALESTTWSYLNVGAINTLKRDAVADLVNHGETTVVVPIATLGAYPEVNLRRLDGYIAAFDEAVKNRRLKKIVLFLPLNGRSNLRSDQWKREFVDWYSSAVLMLKQHGWESNQIYFYPYDEPSTGMIPEALSFYRWAKDNILNIKFFATASNRDALVLQGFVDILVVKPELAEGTIRKSGETWVYDTKGPGKKNGIYSYYRLLPWLAVANSMSGAGFWSYSDFGDVSEGWDDIQGERGYNYSPVYVDNKNNLISSRRWEAWRVGLEDAALLRALDDRDGRAGARERAMRVLSAPEGSNSDADAVRQVILRELTK